MIKSGKVKVIFTMVMVLTFSLILRVEAGEDNLEQGRELYLSAREDWYNSASDIGTVIGKLEESDAFFEKLDQSFEKYYLQGQVYILLGELYEVLGNQRQTYIFFDKSNEYAQKALEKDSKSSQAHRLAADTYLRLMPYKGRLFGITAGPKALELLITAIELDENNYAALNSFGVYLVNAPEVGGGDPNEAIGVLKEALESDYEYDNFISYIWLGEAYAKTGNKSRAIDSAKKALEIYSNSGWAKINLQSHKGI